MSVFSVGKVSITRIEETYLPVYRPGDIFPEYCATIAAAHAHWMAPHHYDAEKDLIKLSVHSWLLQIDGKKILIDCCCGNNRSRPTRPFWDMLNEPYLDRLAAAGARPQDIDYVMCTHLHHDHVGWNTKLRDGTWVPTFPNARYIISKPDFEYYRKLDADPDKAEPVEFGTFRECVLPIVEGGRAELVTGPHRIDEYLDIIPAPGHSAGHVVFRLEDAGDRALFTGDVFHHLLQVYYPYWNFPKNSDVEMARQSRRMVLELAASTGALMLPGHVGAPFAGYIDATEKGFRPRFGVSGGLAQA